MLKSPQPGTDDYSITGWAAFANPTLESDFLALRLKKSFQALLVTLVVMLLFIVLAVVVDVFFNRSSALSSTIMTLRLVHFSLTAATLLFLLRQRDSPWLPRVAELYVAAYLTVAGFLLFHREHLGFIEPVTQIGNIFAIYLLTPFTWRTQLSYAAMWTVGSMAGWYVKIGLGFEFFSILLWQLFSNGAGAFVARHLNLFARELFRDQRLQARQEEVERHLRMQLTTLIDLITHELRNPLASVQTQADLIARTSSDHTAVRLATKIATASQRAAQVIRQWVEQGDAIPIHPPCVPAEVLDLPQLVDQVAQELRSCYVGFQVDFAVHQVPAVRVDARIVLLAVSNVLENAAKYASSARPVRVQFRVNAHVVTVRIRDFGPGIALDNQERIFLKYQRLKASDALPAGKGLGLYLVREMLESVGARIRVQSQPGWGSAFLIELPRA
jgi:signal transduction histidine kinase